MDMSTDKKVDELSKKVSTKLDYSENLTNKRTIKPNVEKLKKFTKQFRRNLEDYTVEPTPYAATSGHIK